jgi:hypothetical protein
MTDLESDDAIFEVDADHHSAGWEQLYAAAAVQHRLCAAAELA